MPRVGISYEPFSRFPEYAGGKPLGWGWIDLGDWPVHWVDMPGRSKDAPTVAAFRLRFDGRDGGSVRIHVSADNRYRLFLDGAPIGRGPERGDAAHWRFETYDLDLSAGAHTLVALNWWLGDLAPFAQMTVRPGLLLAAQGEWLDSLSTGRALWEAKAVEGYAFRRDTTVWGTGARETVDGSRYPWGIENGEGEGWAPVEKVIQGMSAAYKNEVPPYWLLTPATLPPMREGEFCPAALRHLCDGVLETARPVRAAEHLSREAAAWSAWLEGRGTVTVPAGATRTALVDLGNYHCAYPVLTVSGGRGARISLSWAEALFTALEGWDKGHRGEVEGKYFRGATDEFLPDGGSRRSFTTLWWRAGKYVALTVAAGPEPVTLDSLTLLATGYPHAFADEMRSSDGRFAAVRPIALRTLEMCSHETYMDCPYYEQLMYVGDTRLEVLTTYASTRDDRLPKKAIALFSDSRKLSGFTQSRYPSRVWQVIPPFSIWWIAMVYDYWMWRDDAEFVKRLLPAVRSVAEAFRTLIRPDGLMDAPNGWNFMDWVDKPKWDAGVPAEADFRPSSIVNLQFALILTHKARMEDWAGEPALARRDRALAGKLVKAVLAQFWHSRRGLIADDSAHTLFSEHAQCLAILTGLLPAARLRRIAEGLVSQGGLARTTIYFTHYLFETYYRLGRADKFMERMGLWFSLPALGFSTTLEMPEPSRSDCHAWAAHPVYHYYATVLGIRPAAAGFSKARIAPMLPDAMEWAEGTMPHPKGEIRVALRRRTDAVEGEITLPEGVDGAFVWKGRTQPLVPGANALA